MGQQEILTEKFSRGMKALGQADFSSAIEVFVEIVAADPHNALAWLQLGLCYLETHEHEKARKALKASVIADTTDADAHYLLGTAEGSFGNLEEAAASYQRALKVNPGHIKAEEFLIRTQSLLTSRGHFRTALKILSVLKPSLGALNSGLRELVQSVAIFPNSPAGNHLLVCARKLFSQAKAFEVSINLETTPTYWYELCERGYQSIQFRNWPAARQSYEEALSYVSDAAFIHHALGFAFIETEEMGNAVAAWMRTLELDPNYDFRRFGRVRAK